MRKAQIRDGRVVNVIEVDPARVPNWCADWPDAGDAGPGWVVAADGSLQAPPAGGMTADEARGLIVTAIEAAAVAITGDVPEPERLSWTVKEQIARQHIAGAGTALMLETEAALTGESVDILARKIVDNADRYRHAIATMTGIRRAAFSDLDVSLDPREVFERVQTDLAALIEQV